MQADYFKSHQLSNLYLDMCTGILFHISSWHSDTDLDI